ncbi:hypothetical protein KCU87_g116, partial [Aureobasidium melanogenum]
LFLLYLLLPAAKLAPCAMQPRTTSHWQIGGLPLPPVACHGSEPLSNGALLRRRPVNSSCDNDVFAINLTCCSDAIAAVAVHVQPHQAWPMHLLSHVTSTHVLPSSKAF